MQRLSRLVPSLVRRPLRRWWYAAKLRGALRALRAVPAGMVPPKALLRRLSTAWQNEGYSADIGYLKVVARRASEVRGPVLECGTGLTTLVLAAGAARRGLPVWSLEQDTQWASRMTAPLRLLAAPNVHVTRTPLAQFGAYAWYTAPIDRLPKGLRLVVCDGPPGDTPGGRYGLLPQMREWLASGAIILLDDAGREDEREILRRWQQEYQVSVELRAPERRAFAVVTCP